MIILANKTSETLAGPPGARGNSVLGLLKANTAGELPDPLLGESGKTFRENRMKRVPPSIFHRNISIDRPSWLLIDRKKQKRLNSLCIHDQLNIFEQMKTGKRTQPLFRIACLLLQASPIFCSLAPCFSIRTTISLIQLRSRVVHKARLGLTKNAIQ